MYFNPYIWCFWISSRQRITDIYPSSGVNLREFERKLSIIYMYLFLSPRISSKQFLTSAFLILVQLLSYLKSRFNFFWSVKNLIISNTSIIIVLRLKYYSLRLNLEFSILARSSISLIKLRSIVTENKETSNNFISIEFSLLLEETEYLFYIRSLFLFVTSCSWFLKWLIFLARMPSSTDKSSKEF